MEDSNILNQTAQLAIQLSIIIFSAWGSSVLMKKIKLPSVIGYILTGIVIGPFLLGSIHIPFIFPDGAFAFYRDNKLVEFPIHTFAGIASIFLLFHAGLETDVNLFMKYAFKGSVIGLSEIIFSFAGAYYVSTLFFPDLDALHPTHLFMATIATATSVSITSNILSNRKKMTSPEGVTMLSAAVLDDVLGVIILAIVAGIAASYSNNSTPSLVHIFIIAIRSLSIWLGCTAVGILCAKRFSNKLKKTIRSRTQISIIVIGLALLFGGLFESIGLSMIIGAYIVGLTLSNTDLSYVIQEKISPILVLFIPIFFIVSGMNINVFDLIKPEILSLGLAYGLMSMLSKFVGSGLPALTTGFTFMGAARIGSGMMPRGAVALVIANIALSSGFVSSNAYSAVMMMIILNTTLSPLIFNLLLSSPLKSIRGTAESSSITEKAIITLKHDYLTRLVVADFLVLIEKEGFFANKIGQKEKSIYHIRRDTIFMTLHHLQDEATLILYSEKKSILFFKTALYEAVSNIAESAQIIKDNIKLEQFVNVDINQEETDRMLSQHNNKKHFSLQNYMSPFLINLHLQSSNKEKIIQELVAPLAIGGFLSNKELFIQDVLKREQTFSTGLQNGIAMPHAKSHWCKETKVVIGLKPEGVDFNSLDGKPSTLFVLIAAPSDRPHLAVLTELSVLLHSDVFREKLISCKKEQTVMDLFS